MTLLRWLTICLSLYCASLSAWANQTVKVGILSYRALDKTQQQWHPLADYLSRTIPGYHFEIIPLYYPDLDKALSTGHLAFILTNPEHYTILRQRLGLSAIATLMPMAEGHPVNQFGGVMVAKAERSDLITLTHLNGKTVASPDSESFGGFITQQWELYKHGIKPKRFVFTGMPHDKVITEVLQGRADVGFVRSGIIEALIKEGVIAEGTLKIINQQIATGFPQIISTGLYPEWPFAALLTTDAKLVKAVTLALLNLDNQHPVAQTAKIFGFSPPGDYSKVEAVMLNMDIHPDKLKNINLLDVYYHYRHPLWGMVVMLAVILLLSIKLLRIHRHLRHLYLKYHLVANYTSDWEYWISPEGQVIYTSPACQAITGYSPEDFKQDPELILNLVHSDDRARFKHHWQNHDYRQQPDEMEFRILDRASNVHWVHHLCQPVFDKQQRYQGIRASNRDVTQRKQMELELRLHDAALKSCVEGIVITDVNANIQWVNPAFCELTGYAETETLGKTPAELVKSGQQDDGFYKSLWQTILSGQPWRGEIVNRRKNGEYYDEQLSITPVFGDKQAISHFVAVKQDISERKRNQEQIQRLAYYDPLTQLPNRRLLIDRLEKVLAACRRHQQYGALLFLDLDRFKPLNDRYGHDAGDQLLQEVAKRLKEAVRQEDTVARLGGDEFVVVLVELDSDQTQAVQQAEQVAFKLHQILANAYVLWLRHAGAVPKRVEYQLTASIGISLFMDAESNANKILKQADIAMYDAKHQGRNAICLFH